MTTERTWTITDANGTRRVTLAQFRAEIDARAKAAQPIVDAFRRNDMAGVEAAQVEIRKRFA